jgi:hypothetical protein
MGGWSDAAGHGNWGQPGGEDRRVRRRPKWVGPEIAVLVIAFLIRWELGLAFLALKLWHQVSGDEGSVFSFARRKWEGLAASLSSLLSNGNNPFASSFGARSSGNFVFDEWRRGELARIEAERQKLQAAERDFSAYREELLRARDRETFERFMQGRKP